MKVSDAMTLIRTLKTERDNRMSLIQGNPYHADFQHHRDVIKELKNEIERIEELVYNMELEDSYDKKTLEFMNKYGEVENG